MRVVCETLAEFFENLDQYDLIAEGIIRIASTSERSSSNIIEEFYAQVSTVVFSKQPGFPEFLLEVAVSCGTNDAETAPDAGTQELQALKENVTQYANSRGWRVLPGAIFL